MKKVMICGLGAVGHSIAATINAEQIDVLISKEQEIKEIYTKQLGLGNKIDNVYTYETIDQIDHDVLIITLPYRFKITVSQMILPKVSAETTIIIIPANQGILSYFPKEIQKHPLVLFERVPHISRVDEYGKTVNVFGTKEIMNISFVNGADKNKVAELFPLVKEMIIHDNQMDISLITSNAVIHSCRVYELYEENNNYDKTIRFYYDWTDRSSELYIKLEQEVFNLIDEIEMANQTSINYYDMLTHFGVDKNNPTCHALTTKIQNNKSFQPITFYAKDKAELAENRYVVDDMIIGMRLYLELGKKYNVAMPTFKLLFEWACKLVADNQPEIYAEVIEWVPDTDMF